MTGLGTPRRDPTLANIQTEATAAHAEAAEANVAAGEAARLLKVGDADRLGAIQQVAERAHEDARAVAADLDRANQSRARASRLLAAIGALFLVVLLALAGLTYHVGTVAHDNHALNAKIADCITPGSPCYERAQAHDQQIRDDILKQEAANSAKLDELLARLPK